MENFVCTPKTAIIFGKDSETKVGTQVRQYAQSCLFLNDGNQFLAPVYAKVRTSLQEAGVQFWEISNVVSNPCLSLIRSAMELVRKNKIGFILSVGGGSVMDTGKFIAFGVNYPGDPFTYVSYSPVKHDVLPHGAVATMPGTGSEFSDCAMIVNDECATPYKGMFNHPILCNDFAIINPEIGYTLPPKQIACGGFDAITHCLEYYLCNTDGGGLMEHIFEAAIRTCLKDIPLAIKDPKNYSIRSELALSVIVPCSNLYFYSGCASDWGVHWIEAPITTMFHGTHGATLACILPAWMKYVYPRNPQKFYQFAENCMGAYPDPFCPENTILEGIRLLENWLRSVGLPIRLQELHIDTPEKETALNMCMNAHPSVGMYYQLTRDDVSQILKLAE